ncbi:MAG: fluoride efflux transporter CrcB [Myxococcota bacterium]
MIAALLIAAGGALGTLARYGVGVALSRWFGDRLPYGTFAVNVVGSFVIGFAMVVFASRGQLDSHSRMALTIGFLGGFTTYSSFALETVTLLERRQLPGAAGYVAATLLMAALACWAGMGCARILGGR